MWPPNHSHRDVGLGIDLTDACEGQASAHLAVWSDEPDDADTGDGTTTGDARIEPPSLFLRAERKGDADGRVYLVIGTATGPLGSQGTDCAVVGVPHSRSQGSLSSLSAQMQAALDHCAASGTAPASFGLLADGSFGDAVNQAPVVSAGADQSVDFPGPALLSGSVNDDGLPSGTLSIAWSVVSGPGDVSFGSPASAATSATFSAAGSYVLRLTASDGLLSASDDVTVVVAQTNAAPVVSAGPDIHLTLPQTQATLQGSVSDDGNPAGTLTIAWSVVSAPGSVAFADAADPGTQVTLGGTGEYVLRLSADDSQFQTSDDVRVVMDVETPPVLSVSDGTVIEGHDGTRGALVNLTLSKPWSRTVAVDYITEDGSASAGCDYRPRYGRLEIAPGETAADILVPVIGDVAPEPDESLVLRLGNAVEAVLDREQALLTIGNDDGVNEPPLRASAPSPVDGAQGVAHPPTLSWSVADPDGDLVTSDLYLGTTFGTDGQSWVRACPGTPEPGPRAAAAVGYDEAGDRMMLVGGQGAAADTLWVLSDASGTGGSPMWQAIGVAGGPAHLARAAAGYDAATNRLIVHGGCADAACATASSETWALTHANGQGGTPTWLPLASAGPALMGAVSAFDLASGSLVVFGGTSGGAASSDVFVLDASAGTRQVLTPSGPAPAPRGGGAGAYDPATNRLFVFGGEDDSGAALGDLWVLTHANGQGGTPAWQALQASGPAPVGRRGASAVFDPSSGRVLVFGGTTAGLEANANFVFSDAWLLTATEPEATWVKVATGAGAPLGRFDAHAAYSASANRLIVALGSNNKVGDPADLWMLAGAMGSLPLFTGDLGSPSTLAEGLTPGAAYLWRVVTRDPSGAWRGSDTWSFTANQAPVVDAGPDVAVTLPHHADLLGTVSDDGLPASGALETEWTLASGPAPVTFASASAAATAAEFEEAGTYVLRLSATDGALATSDELTVTVTGSHTLPELSVADVLVAEGDAGSIDAVFALSLSAAAADDVSVDYTTADSTAAAGSDYLARSGTLTIPAGSLGANVSVPVLGDPVDEPYETFRLVLGPVAGATLVRAEALGTIADDEEQGNAAPIVNAGPDQAVTSASAQLNGLVVDDGLPAGGSASQSWSVVSGPGSAVFSNPQAASTAVSFSASGVYVLRLTATDGELQASDDVAISVSLANLAPIVSAGPDQTIASTATTLGGVVTDDGLPGGALALAWSQVSGPGAVSFGTPSAAVTSVTFPGPGAYVLRLEASDSALSSFDEMTVVVEAAPDLVVAALDLSGVETDTATLAIGGTALVSLTNSSAGHILVPFAVALFEDRNGNGTLELGTDALLGSAEAAPMLAGESVSVSVPMNGTVLFAGNLIHALADSEGVVAEPNESNNYADSRPPCEPVTTPLPFTPQLEWAWTGSTDFPTSNNVMMTPLVVDLTADGVPEVVFTTFVGNQYVNGGYLRAVDGRTGAPLFSVTVPVWGELSGYAPIAAGDIDHDGRPEIVVAHVFQGSSNTQLAAFEHDGTFKWLSPSLGYLGAGGPTIADLDADGTPEIVIGRKVLNADGTLRWSGTGTSGQSGVSPVSLVADVDMDGQPEVVAGSTVYRADGTILWRNTSLPDGFNAIGNFDTDPFPEIVLVTPGAVRLLEHDGTVKWGPVTVQTGGYGGPPTVADVDGDGQPEIGVAFAARYVVLEGNGSVKWTAVIQDGSSSQTSSSVFDFEGDGSAEVIYGDELKLRIYRGSDGVVLWERPLSTCTALENPVIADVDADGNAELIAVGNTACGFGPDHGVFVYGDANDNWVVTRKLWNQHAYHVTNVNDDLSIPTVEANSWQVVNSYRRNHLLGACETGRPDLTASYARESLEPSGDVRVTVRIGNAGNAVVGAGVPVAFYAGEPTIGATPLATTTLSVSLEPGQYQDMAATFPASVEAEPLWVVADDAGGLVGTQTETDESNNLLNSGLYLGPVPNEAPVVSAGPDQSVMLPEVATLAGSATDDGEPIGSLTVSWSVVSGPGPVAFGSPASPTTTATFAQGGTYVLRLRATDGERASTDDVTVTAIVNQAPLVDAGPDHSLSQPGQVLLPGSVTDDGLPSGSTVSVGWVLASGPADVTFLSPQSATTFAVFAVPGTYTVRLGAWDGELAGQDTATIVVAAPPQNQPPAVSAGPSRAITLPSDSVALAGSVTDDGLVSPLSVAWSVSAGPGPVVFGSPSQAATTARFVNAGSYLLRLTASDGEFTVFQEVFVSVAPEAAPNAPPSVSAGPPRTLQQPATSLTLAGQAADDGRPLGGSLSLAWGQASGPGPVVFGSPDAATTTATFPNPGTYVLTLYANDGALTSNSSTTVTYLAPNQPPTVSAGPDLGVAVPPGTASLAGNASDDGLPGLGLTVAWTQLSGPAPVSFANAASATTAATFAAAGVYTLRLTASDGELAASDDVVVTATQGNAPPVPSAGSDQTITLPTTSVVLSGGATDDGVPVGGSLGFAWSLASGPAPVVFGTPNAATTTASFDATGSYLLRLTATDGALSASDDVAVSVLPGAAVGDPPTVALASPLDGAAVIGPVDVVASLSSQSLLSWKLLRRMADESSYTTLATGTAPLDGVLGTLDPTLLLNGHHELVLRATDTAGRVATTAVSLVVKENRKVGHFSVAFTDLEVPVAGIPIRLTRTYDSRDKRVGDFGFGWRLDLDQLRITESRTPGLDWTGTRSQGPFPSYCVEETKNHQVSLTLPDGKLEEFRLTLGGACQPFAPPDSVTASYQPLPGTRGQLAPLGGNSLVVVGSFPGSVQLFHADTFDVFDPESYEYTAPDGRVLVVKENVGLTSLRDLSDNTLTVSPAGVIHSSGKSVAFTRDAQGRITRITDPDGHDLIYAYDAQGDLESATDRESNTTRFGYDPAFPHHLASIEDPLGRTPIRNEYYPDGRLQRHTDAFGKTIEYAHSLATRQEIVTDRTNEVRVLEYDEPGNVVKETQPDGRQVLRSFDARNNRTSETEPHEPSNPTPATTAYTYDAQDNVLTVTDPNGNVTEHTYNARQQVLTTKDARGRYTVNTYDANGNLTRTQSGGTLATGPFLSDTTSTYDARGNLKTQTTVVDGVPQVTSYDYDGFGNLTREIDAEGHETTYTYDARGNRRTQTTTRTLPGGGTETLVTQYDYDNNGRLTRTTDPDGTFTRTVYDALGRQVESYDKLGRKTEYAYDEMGRLTRTTHADLTFEESTFDNEGRRLTSRDRGGRTTGYEYDSLGRLKQTAYPDLSFTQNTYDAAGRLTATTDARGKSTTYGYDSGGRRTNLRDPLGNETVFTYDPNGNQQNVRDARLNTTTFTYDDLNRRTRTTFPDGTYTETTYDVLGRRTAERDQAGRVTEFRYDKVGRLTRVIDATGHETTYGYDEVGNRTRQTDANNHTTLFEYDRLGRETARILPDNSREEKTYDDAGNLETRTDFMGRVTTYSYDANNRLTSRSYPNASENVGFTHTATGRRDTVTDSRGVTSYGYDLRDRLTSLIQPGVGSLGFGYDGNGNRTCLTATIGADSHATTWTYDDAGRLDIVTDPAARAHDFGHDPNGNRSSLQYPNGTSTAYTYDALNRLTNLTTTGPLGTVQGYAFTLGPAGNRTRIDEADGTVREYGYDALYRLTSETVRDGLTTLYAKTSAYDPVGNRQTQTTTGGGAPGLPAPGNISYTYDTRDRLLADATSYGYDTNGNLMSKTGEATYVWDHENRLIRVEKADGTVIETEYDADGVRVSTTTTPAAGSPTTTHYLVDTASGLSHVVAETDGAGVLQALYVRGSDELLSVMRPAAGSGWTSRFIHADGIGSIRRLTQEDGTVHDGYSYEAFGTLLAHTGTDPQPYAFAGEPYDPNVGFQYHRARWYQHSTGRFLGVDPHRGSQEQPQTLHGYLYAAGDPSNRVDPTGRFFLATTFVGSLSSIISTIAVPNLLSILPVAGAASSQNQERAIEEAVSDALAILSTENACTRFFCGPNAPKDNPATAALQELSAMLTVGYLDNPQTGISLAFPFRYRGIGDVLTYRVPTKATVNSQGPFFNTFNLRSSSRLNRIGSYAPNTRSARLLMILHEVGHMVVDPTIPQPPPSNKPLLKDDNDNASQSQQNTEIVERECRSAFR